MATTSDAPACPCCVWADGHGFSGEVQTADPRFMRIPRQWLGGAPDDALPIQDDQPTAVCAGCADWLDQGAPVAGFGSEPVPA